MYWQRSRDDLQRENLETAIHLYEAAFSLHEEEKWLRIIETILRAGFIFTGEDLCEDVRGERKKHHQEHLNKFLGKTADRRSKKISKSDLAQELRSICGLTTPSGKDS